MKYSKNHINIFIIIIGILSYIYLFCILNYTIIAIYFITLIIGYIVIGKYVFILNFILLLFLLLLNFLFPKTYFERFLGLNDGIIENRATSGSRSAQGSLKISSVLSSIINKTQDGVYQINAFPNNQVDYSDEFEANLDSDTRAYVKTFRTKNNTGTVLDSLKDSDSKKIAQNSDIIINKKSDKNAIANILPSPD